jgi:hypothetical protein
MPPIPGFSRRTGTSRNWTRPADVHAECISAAHQGLERHTTRTWCYEAPARRARRARAQMHHLAPPRSVRLPDPERRPTRSGRATDARDQRRRPNFRRPLRGSRPPPSEPDARRVLSGAPASDSHQDVFAITKVVTVASQRNSPEQAWHLPCGLSCPISGLPWDARPRRRRARTILGDHGRFLMNRSRKNRR